MGPLLPPGDAPVAAALASRRSTASGQGKATPWPPPTGSSRSTSSRRSWLKQRGRSGAGLRSPTASWPA
eukprot:2678067-Lingulodinium_polyedra.AAC.1